MPLPLEGVRVLDLTISWAGPHATALLADLGAEVLKLEAVQHPDLLRGADQPNRAKSGVFPNREPGEKPWNRTAFFNVTNRNKKAFTLDLSRPRGVELFKRLLPLCDVVAESFSVDVMKRFGLDYPALKSIKENIIMLSMPAFGTSGPYRSFRIFGHSTEAIALQKGLRAYAPGERPMGTPIAYGDLTAGVTAAFAILAALVHRRRTGRGQHIDLSHVEAMIPLLGEVVLDYTMNGRTAVPVGNQSPAYAPQGVYRCAGNDSWIAITVENEAKWQDLTDLIPALAENRFAGPADRRDNQGDLDQIIEDWTREHDKFEAMELLQRRGIAAGAVINSREALANPQLRSRGCFEEVTLRDAGTHPYLGMLFKLSESPLDIRNGAPGLGADNRYVFQDLLGFDAKGFEELESSNLIGQRPVAARRS